MKIAPDTNLLVRALMRDDPLQAAAAERALSQAEVIALALPCLCELVRVLESVYRQDKQTIVTALRVLLDSEKVQTNRPAVEAGLAVLGAGGDFADGVIAHEGKWLGAEVLVSFDWDTVRRLRAAGFDAHLPSANG